MSTTTPNPLFVELDEFVDKLPAHEAALVRASLVSEKDIPSALELLEQEVRRYPDDAEMWHQLGEAHYHSGGQALAEPGAARRAFTRAIELDSTFTLPYIHLIDDAILAGDSAGTARLLRIYTRLAPKSPFVGWLRLASSLAFGDSTPGADALSALDTLETADLFRMALSLQGPGCCWRRSEEILRLARKRRDLHHVVIPTLFWTSLSRGRARDAIGWLNDPEMPENFKPRGLYALHNRGIAIPRQKLDSALALQRADSSDALDLFFAGVYAADRKRWDVHGSSLAALRSLADRLRGAGDSAVASFAAAGVGLQGYGLWHQGNRDTALRLLEQAQRQTTGYGRFENLNMVLRWWLGLLLVELGKPREAVLYFESLRGTAFPADYERGRIHQQLGEPDQARSAYAAFLTVWDDADPQFQPMVREARAAIQRLASATPE